MRNTVDALGPTERNPKTTHALQHLLPAHFPRKTKSTPGTFLYTAAHPVQVFKEGISQLKCAVCSTPEWGIYHRGLKKTINNSGITAYYCYHLHHILKYHWNICMNSECTILFFVVKISSADPQLRYKGENLVPSLDLRA